MIARIVALVLLGFMLIGSPTTARAECNAICRQKCEATAHHAHNTVAECIQKWSYINAKYGKAAAQFAGKGAWNRDLCQLQCRLKWRIRGYSSVAACVADIPCSRFK